MRRLITCFAFFAIPGLLVSCGGHAVKLQTGGTVSKDGLSLSTEWVKVKEKKFDVRLIVMNQSGKPVVFSSSDISCFRGAAQGELKGPRDIALGIGQKKFVTLTCDCKVKATGDFRVQIAEVFENPGADGKTRGAVVAKNIEWTAK